MDQLEEFTRARLALISAGQPPLGAPRRAADEPAPTEAEPPAAAPEQPPVEPKVTTQGPWRRFGAAVTPRHAAVVGLLLVAAVVVTIFALGRSAATEVQLTPEAVAETPAAATPSPSVPTLLRVHVGGAVAEPGVVQVPAGSIVQDAIAAAGGLTAEADPASLNLAAPVSDGMQILIGTVDEPLGEIETDQAADGGGGSSTDGVVDLNTATQAELEELPGVGPVMAAAILAWREENGKFGSVEELQEISGIGPKTYEKLAPLVRT